MIVLPNTNLITDDHTTCTACYQKVSKHHIYGVDEYALSRRDQSIIYCLSCTIAKNLEEIALRINNPNNHQLDNLVSAIANRVVTLLCEKQTLDIIIKETIKTLFKEEAANPDGVFSSK